MVLNGERFEYGGITSGVPQVSGLGPRLFQVHNNDIFNAIQSNKIHFADDCIVYRVSKGVNDSNLLQPDMDKVTE